LSDAPSSIHRSVDRVRSGTPLFFPGSQDSTPRRPRRGDIHSSRPADSSPSLARRTATQPGVNRNLFPRSSSPLHLPSTPDANGHAPSGPTLSAIDGEGEGMQTDGEDGMIKYIWGTTISLHEAMNDFRAFLHDFKLKYRAVYNTNAAKATVEAGGIAPPSMPLYDGLTAAQGEETLYERYLRQLHETAQTNLNLDAVNLLAYPPTKKLYHQLLNYPQEVIPIMDQVLRDIMIEKAQDDFDAVKRRFAEGDANELDLEIVESDLKDIEGRIYKVRPFAGDKTINMRDLNPGGESVDWRRG